MFGLGWPSAAAHERLAAWTNGCPAAQEPPSAKVPKGVAHACCDGSFAVLVGAGVWRRRGGLCVPCYLMLILSPKLRLNDVGLCL